MEESSEERLPVSRLKDNGIPLMILVLCPREAQDCQGGEHDRRSASWAPSEYVRPRSYATWGGSIHDKSE